MDRRLYRPRKHIIQRKCPPSTTAKPFPLPPTHKKSPLPQGKGLTLIRYIPLQLALSAQFAILAQSAFFIHVVLLHLVQLAFFALACLTGTSTLAINDVAANKIASTLKLIFFMLILKLTVK